MTIDWGAVQTAKDKAQAAAKVARGLEREAARRFLADTDWYVLRAADGGAPVPDDVRARRGDARLLLSRDPERTLER